MNRRHCLRKFEACLAREPQALSVSCPEMNFPSLKSDTAFFLKAASSFSDAEVACTPPTGSEHPPTRGGIRRRSASPRRRPTKATCGLERGQEDGCACVVVCV